MINKIHSSKKLERKNNFAKANKKDRVTSNSLKK